MMRSRYFWVSVLVTLISWARWGKAGWWDDVISVTPSMLGFSIAVFTLFLGFGSESFRLSRMRGEHDDDTSPPEAQESARSKLNEINSVYVRSAANFLHFILVQMLALVMALCMKAVSYAPIPVCLETPFLQGVVDSLGLLLYFSSYLFFIYGCFLSVASTMGMFRLARMQNLFHSVDPRGK